MFDDKQDSKKQGRDGSHYIPAEPLELVINPGTASAAEIAELFSALSDLNVACGGLGITFEVTVRTINGFPVVEGKPNTLGSMDQPPHSFDESEEV